MGPIGDTGDPERGERGGRRCAGQAENADLALAKPVDQRADRIRVEATRDEHAAGSRVEERLAALERVGEDLGTVAVTGFDDIPMARHTR